MEKIEKRLIENKVFNEISKLLGIETDEFTLETDLANDFGADSLDQIELMMNLENKFDIIINDEQFNDCRTPKQIIDLIEKSI
jgi:acyl carrier protein